MCFYDSLNGDQNLCAVEESKAKDEDNVEDKSYTGKENFMTWAKAALMTFSEDMLIRLHDDSQSKVFYYAIFISSITGLGDSEWVREVLGLSLNVGLEALAESLNIPEGSQDKDSLKMLTELLRSQSMKVLALLVGSLVIVVMKNEGVLLHFHDMGKDHGMRKRKKREGRRTMILSVLSSLALVSGLMVVRAKNLVHSILFPFPVFRNTSDPLYDVLVEPMGYDVMLLEYHGIEYPRLTEALEKVISAFQAVKGGEAFNIMMKETIREGPTLLVSLIRGDLLNASVVQSSTADGDPSMLSPIITSNYIYESRLPDVVLRLGDLVASSCFNGRSRGLQRDIHAKKKGLQPQGVASVPDNRSSSTKKFPCSQRKLKRKLELEKRRYCRTRDLLASSADVCRLVILAFIDQRKTTPILF
uniref:NADH dehydrogenase subunit 6, mitochondrial n=1 Tax=Tanacetum cinerariifolium TaxID=118510 RepID=A0A6L2JH91_TANCI|nr:NADH dehydrogenase subunit 6, mitochondrial [Tanacetum cinerariifolium]